MNIYTRKISWPMSMVFLGVLQLATLTNHATANSLSGRASFAHAIKGGENQKESQTLSQRYSTGFSSKPTDAININGALGYNKNWRKESGSRSSYQQNAGININNDLFSATLNEAAGFQMPTDRPNSKSFGWNSSFTSKVSKKFLPTFRVNYGQSSTASDAIPRTSDTKSQRAGFATGLNLNVGQLSYRYNTSTTTNNITKTESRNSSQNASFGGGRNFWNNRVSLRFSQGYSQNTSGYTRYIQPTGLVDLPIRCSVSTSAIDATPTFDPLSSTPALADDDLGTQALALNNGDALNIGFSSDELAANRIYLYLDPTIVLNVADASTLRFSLYTSAITDGNVWTQITTNLAPTYDDQEHRYTLDYNFNFTDTIYKLVATNWPTATLSITELQLVSRQPGASIPQETKKTSSSSSTTLSTRLLLYKNVPLNYSFSFSNSKNPNGVKSKSRSNAGNLNLHWNLNKYCQPSLTMNTSTSRRNSQATRTNRSIGLTINSTPLPTVHVNFGATQSENFRDSTKQASANNFRISVGAALYPDLSASLSANRSQSRQTISGSSSTALKTGFGLTAHLSSKLTTSFGAGYSRQSSESGTGESTARSSKGGSLSMNIRPSDILSFQIKASQSWNNSHSPISYSVNGSLILLRTRKTQVSTGLSYNNNGHTSSSSYSGSWSWILSRYITMQTRGSFSNATTKSWNVSSQLSTSF